MRFTETGRSFQNGIIRPANGTLTGMMWKIADDLSDLPDQPARRCDYMYACKGAGFDMVTSSNQFTRWRKFNGIKGRRKHAR